MSKEESSISPSHSEPTLSSLHPLLQKEDARRSNRRKRWQDGAAAHEPTFNTSNLDTSISRSDLSSESILTTDKSEQSLTDMSRKLSQMQASLDTMHCSEQFLKEENSKLIERLAIARSASVDDSMRDTSCVARGDVSLGEELRASLLEAEKERVEGKRAREELRLSRKRTGYLESELETYKLRLSLSEARTKEAEQEVSDSQRKLDGNEAELSALRSRESEVSRLLSEAETDRRSLERIREVQSTLTENSHSIDQLRQSMLSSERRANALDEENRTLLDRVAAVEREKRELEGAEKGGTARVKGLEDKIVGLEAELIKAKAESLTNEKRLAGIEKAKEAELNYLKDQVNTKDQLIACKSMELEGARKEANSCRQEVKGMTVALEIKEFELEQLREFKILVKNQETSSDKEDKKQLSLMKETLSDIQNRYQELVNNNEAEKKENSDKQESLASQIAELKKSRKSLIKQLKQLEQLYTVKETTHASIEGEFSKLSKLFYVLKDRNLLPDSSEVHSVVESIYQPSVSRLTELSSIHMDPDSAQFNRSGLKRSQSEGSELKGILKKPHDFSPRSSTPNTSHEFNPNLAYTASKHNRWLPRKETSDIL